MFSEYPLRNIDMESGSLFGEKIEKKAKAESKFMEKHLVKAIIAW